MKRIHPEKPTQKRLPHPDKEEKSLHLAQYHLVGVENQPRVARKQRSEA
jgi:hypothetical protein